MKSTFFSLCTLALMACESKLVSPVANQEEQASAVVADVTPIISEPPKLTEAEALRAFEIFEFDPAIAQGLKIRGKVEGLHWNDKSGRNAILFISESRRLLRNDDKPPDNSIILKAGHLIRRRTQWTVDYAHEEETFFCSGDPRANTKFDARAWSLTDLDQDGFAEATWVWYLECLGSEPRFVKMVVIMIENKIYTLRGRAIKGAEDPFWVDFGFDALSPKILEHARKVWKDTDDEWPEATHH